MAAQRYTKDAAGRTRSGAWLRQTTRARICRRATRADRDSRSRSYNRSGSRAGSRGSVSDPDDDYLIALASASHSLLVSGDGDLLELASRVPVRSPAEFLAMIEVPDPNGT